DYDTAEQRYQASLAIKEELGDRAGIANTYGRLAMLAHDRGDYDTAEHRYQPSLAISAELGDRAGLTATLSHIGHLPPHHAQITDAVDYQLQSLAIRAELGLLTVQNDVRMLRKQRAALGDGQFLHILQALLDTDNTATVMHLTEEGS